MDASRGVSAGSTATLAGERAGSLPPGLASMAPGPQLAMVLASVDRSAVTSEDLPELVRARARLLAFEQAEFLLDLLEAVHGAAAEPGSTQRYDSEGLKEDAAVELGWALRWSESWTAHQIELAQDLVRRLPMVFDALRAGRLDRERALAFVDSLRFVDESVARSVAAKLVDRAERWTLGQLRDKAAVSQAASVRSERQRAPQSRANVSSDRADPASKRRRYRAAVAERGVWLRGNDDGTANLSGLNLPPHRAAAAFDRLDRLARAARRDGDGRNLSQLRADAFTDLLAGVPFQLAPGTDPVSAEADAQHPVGDPLLGPPGLPKRRRQPRTSAHHDGELTPAGEPTRNAPTCGGPGHAATGSGMTAMEPHRSEHPDRIDLYDYDEVCLTDEDRWWLSRLPIPPDPPAPAPPCRLPTGNSKAATSNGVRAASSNACCRSFFGTLTR